MPCETTYLHYFMLDDYVFPEDYDPVRRRSAGERLSFLTGVSYLVGMCLSVMVMPHNHKLHSVPSDVSHISCMS